ncbi:MAG: DUF4465 domain-containing protein [Planctomycetota bacterium]
MIGRAAFVSYLIVVLSPFSSAETVVDFEELNLFNGTPPSGVGEYFNGYGQGANDAGFVSQGVTFQTNEFGPGFSYSNAVDTTSPGFLNQFAAFPGGGASATDTSAVIGSNYGMVNTSSSVLADGTPANGATLTLGGVSRLVSLDVANTTYAMLYLRDGIDTDFGGNPQFNADNQFTDGDFFLLRITGFDGVEGTGNVTGSVDYSLADYGAPGSGTGDDFRLEGWDTVDLSGFGDTRSLTFSTTSSQISEFGGFFFHDVPAYAAIDNLTFVTAIPEPSSFAVLMAVGTVLAYRRRRSN